MDSLVGDSVLDETNASSIRDSCCRRIPASTIQFTPFRTIPTLSASNAPRNQRGPLWASPGPKSVAETPEILLVYGVFGTREKGPGLAHETCPWWPAFGGDDNAFPTCGLRIKARRFLWDTLSEHKWIILGERRGALRIVTTACCTILSSSAAMPIGLCRPSGFRR